jgi:hypothetical protein
LPCHGELTASPCWLGFFDGVSYDCRPNWVPALLSSVFMSSRFRAVGFSKASAPPRRSGSTGACNIRDIRPRCWMFAFIRFFFFFFFLCRTFVSQP